jgi:pimeloyl-ACP methyl ester carboxylesterase
MPYTDSKQVRIHYRVEGEGPSLVLQHGFLQSIEDWYECGYVDALKNDYRLVLVDARGHGSSDKPHDPEAYPLENRVADVVAVLDALAIKKAHFWGYSMGGWIAFGMTKFAAERIDRLVIGGQHPYARGMEGYRELLQAGIAHGAEAFLTTVEQMAGPLPPGWKARLREGDLAAYLAIAQDRTSIEAVLPEIKMPCCLYVGEVDPVFAEVRSASKLIPNVNFFSLPELTHLQAFVRVDLVLPRVSKFLHGAA